MVAEIGGSDAVKRAAVDALVWRSRGPAAAVAKISRLKALVQSERVEGKSDKRAEIEEAARWFRSLDFDDREVVSRECLAFVQDDAFDAFYELAKTFIAVEALKRVVDSDSTKVPEPMLDALILYSYGNSDFVALIKRFQRKKHYAALLSVAQNSDFGQFSVEAMSALLDLKQFDLISQALRGPDPVLAVATADVLGSTANGSIAEPLLQVIRDTSLRSDVRRSAVRAVSRVNNGAMELVKLVENKSLDGELEQAAAAALHSAPSRQAREQAQRLFPLPPSKDNSPTLPISELAKLKGDAANGRMVFFSTGTCHKCHVVDGMGREIGPNLSEIGSKLSREAMFESVLYPSAGISHNYEAWTVVLSSGTTVNGLLVSNTDAELQIRGDDAIVRTFAKADVEELVKQKISLMPADLQKTMTSQELADVVEYMQSLKKK